MITFKQFVAESASDKGILKAVFIIGLPGAGKTYTASQLSGTVAPRIVNTDRAAEHISKKLGKQVTATSWGEFSDDAHRITKATLHNYLNGLLPLFIDGTSNNVSNILNRAGILESLGYDVGVVYVKTDLATALQRIENRKDKVNRDVDADFVREVARTNQENAAYLKTKVSFYREVDNSGEGFNDATISKAFKAVQGFYSEPIANPVGARILTKLEADGAKYLIPSIFTAEELARKVEAWYR